MSLEMSGARPLVENTMCRRICEYVPGMIDGPVRRSIPSPRSGRDEDIRSCPRVAVALRRERRATFTRGYIPALLRSEELHGHDRLSEFGDQRAAKAGWRRTKAQEPIANSREPQ